MVAEHRDEHEPYKYNYNSEQEHKYGDTVDTVHIFYPL